MKRLPPLPATLDDAVIAAISEGATVEHLLSRHAFPPDVIRRVIRDHDLDIAPDGRPFGRKPADWALTMARHSVDPDVRRLARDTVDALNLLRREQARAAAHTVAVRGRTERRTALIQFRGVLAELQRDVNTALAALGGRGDTALIAAADDAEHAGATGRRAS